MANFTGSDWGSWAAVAAAIFSGSGIIYALGKWCQRKHPFKIHYSLIEGMAEAPENYVADDRLIPTFSDLVFMRQSEKMSLDAQRSYGAIMQLHPKTTIDIYGVDLQFLGDNQEKPRLIKLRDLNQQARGSEMSYERPGEVNVWYSPEVHTSKGKSVDYCVIFETYGNWKGKLYVRIHLTGHGVRRERINCECKSKNGGSNGEEDYPKKK